MLSIEDWHTSERQRLLRPCPSAELQPLPSSQTVPAACVGPGLLAVLLLLGACGEPESSAEGVCRDQVLRAEVQALPCRLGSCRSYVMLNTRVGEVT